MKTAGELLDFYKNQLMPDILKLEKERKEVAKKLGLADADDYVLLVRGFHSESQLNTPTLTTIRI